MGSRWGIGWWLFVCGFRRRKTKRDQKGVCGVVKFGRVKMARVGGGLGCVGVGGGVGVGEVVLIMCSAVAVPAAAAVAAAAAAYEMYLFFSFIVWVWMVLLGGGWVREG